MNSIPNTPAPWYEGSLKQPKPLRYAFRLVDGDRRGFPYREDDPALEGAGVVSWAVPAALSERARNLISRAMLPEIMVVEKGWSIGVDGGLRLTPEASSAMDRMNEYFALLWKHGECFCDRVVDAWEYVHAMDFSELLGLMRQEGDSMLAAVVLGERLARSQIRVLGSIEEALEDAVRTMPQV